MSRRRSSVVSLLSLGLFGFAALSARPAAAESSCASDSDCVKGWLCQVTSSSGCGYACAPGQDCPPPPDCPTQEFKSCVPGPCTTDSDCATGMVCYTTQVGCDAVPTCPPGADCVEPPPCRPSTQSQCIPRYDAPCTVDADCGAGFTCMADVTGCGCSSAGSAPSSGGSGGAPTPIDPPPTCDCAPATTSSCHAVPQTCTTTADCANGWTCETVDQGGGCAIAVPEPSSGGTGGNTPVPAQDAGVDPCPPPPPPIKECLPPYYSLGGGTLGVGVSANDGVGGGTTSGTTSGTAGTTSAPKAPTENADNAQGQTSTAAGCSVAHGSSGAAGGFALLGLGMFGWLRRRRSALAAR